MPPVPMTKNERDAKRRHTHEYKTKEAARRQTDEYKTKEASRRQTDEYKTNEAARRQTDEYKAKGAARRQTDEHNAKEAARRQTDEYKAKEKARHAGLVYRERAAATMNIWRAHKRQLKFWESCFTRWQESVCVILNDMVEGSNHIFMYEPQKLTELVRDDLWQCALGKMTRLCAQPYAPCFGSDGSILLVQHGMPHILPSLKRPRGLFGAALVESLREYKLALLLRCRLGPCLDEPGQCDPSSGYLGFAEHHWFAKKFGYRCPMQGVSKGAIPKPTASIRRFLCNNQCPLRCCTSRCPWHRNAGKWNRVGSSECCPCGDDSCNTCVPQDSSRDASLQDPPPPGYKLYTGVGEPISDSSSSQKEVFQLVCEHYKFVPVLIGASYAGFYNRIDRSSGFQLYPHNWDTERYEQVDCEVDSVSVIGSDQTWTREQRDAWLREPFYHEWKWRPFHGVRLMAASESNYGSSISLDFCLSANARNPLYESALDYLLSASLMNRVEVRKEQRGLVSDVLEGPTSTTCAFCKYVAGKTAFPPEDIALRAAQAVAIFQATLEGTNPLLGPWDVLSIAEHWRDVCANLAPSNGERVCEQKQRSLANVEAAVRRVATTLGALKEELAARVENALSAKTQRDQEERERDGSCCQPFVRN